MWGGAFVSLARGGRGGGGGDDGAGSFALGVDDDGRVIGADGGERGDADVAGVRGGEGPAPGDDAGFVDAVAGVFAGFDVGGKALFDDGDVDEGVRCRRAAGEGGADAI